jgi:hypothetical protein
MKIIKGNKPINNEDDCHCGKPLRINDPRRKKIIIKRTIKKRK